MLALALCMAAAQDGVAQVIMERAVVGTGGGRIAGSTMTMDLTIGQPVVGRAASSATVGEFGFWSNPLVISSAPGPGVAAGPVTALDVTPNPVTESATIEVTLARSGPVDVVLYDMNGRGARTLYSGTRSAGRFSIPLDPAGLASGSYFVAVSVPGGLLQHPVTVVR
jgi:hypothetical protein